MLQCELLVGLDFRGLSCLGNIGGVFLNLGLKNSDELLLVEADIFCLLKHSIQLFVRLRVDVLNLQLFLFFLQSLHATLQLAHFALKLSIGLLLQADLLSKLVYLAFQYVHFEHQLSFTARSLVRAARIVCACVGLFLGVPGPT